MSFSTNSIYSNVVNLCIELNLPLPSKPTTLGRLGELLYYKLLKLNNKNFKALCLYPKYTSCDFIVDEKRIEIKASSKGKDNRFTFTFTKNIGLFDELICILLDPIENPIFIKIPKEKLKDKVAIAGKKEYFNRFNSDSI